jgi:hypothetical protein
MQASPPSKGPGQIAGTALVTRLIEQIGNHYRDNVANSFLRPALFQLPLDPQDWSQIEILTRKQTQDAGFALDELYRQISAAARFVFLVRNDLLPVLKNRLTREAPGSRKVFQDMAINNSNSNLKIFADLLNELYLALTELDKQNSCGRTPVYRQMPELLEVSRLLAP